MISRILNLNERPLLKRIVHGGIWSVIGEVGTRLFPFITAIIIARLLGVEGFGSFAMIQATAGAFSVIGGFGLGSTATKYVAEYRFNNPEKANEVITLTLFFAGLTGMIATLALAITSPLVALKVLANLELSTPLFWAAPMLLFNAIYGAIGGILLGFERTRAIAKLSAISSVVISVFTITGIYHFGVLGGAIAISLGALLQMLFGLVMLKEQLAEQGLSFYTKNYQSQRKLLWGFSLPSTLATMMHIPVVWLAQAIVVNQPSGYEQLGLYNAAQKWQTLIILLPMAFSSIYLPVLSSMNAEENYSRYLRTTHKLAFSNFIFCLPLILILIVFPDQIMGIFGTEFVSGSRLLIGMAILSLILVTLRVYWQALIGLGKAWVSFYLTVIWAISVLGITWHYRSSGGEGLLLGFLIAGLVHLIAHIVYLLNINPSISFTE